MSELQLTQGKITVSIGIAEVPRHGETINDILREADSALYLAKETGRDRVVAAQLRSEKMNPNSE